MSASSPVLGAAAAAAADLARLRERVAGAPEAAALRPIGMTRVVIGSDVLGELPGIIAAHAEGGPVAVLADAVDIRRAGESVKPRVLAMAAGVGPVREVVVGRGGGVVHADEETVEQACRECLDARLIVTVGSGTLADIGKAVSAMLGGLAHVVVQTAASVNGYADDRSVLLRHGVKRTVETRWPDVLVVDLTLLADAPAELTTAGFGDLLAMFTAPADWLLARLVGQDESYSPATVALVREHGAALLAAADGVRRGTAGALAELAGGLTLAGIGMGVAGRTSPGSGMEHTVSHLIEMHTPAAGDQQALHGAKVGISVVLAALLWERVLAEIAERGLGGLAFPSEEQMRERVLGAFAPLDPTGAMGAECWRDYARKLERWHAARPRLAALAADWAEHDRALGELVAPPRLLADALRATGAPTRLSELGIDAATARWALANCHLMRDRFTVADLAFLLGVWEHEDREALLVAADRMGVGL